MDPCFFFTLDLDDLFENWRQTIDYNNIFIWYTRIIDILVHVYSSEAGENYLKKTGIVLD